jgi:hypothetical protein
LGPLSSSSRVTTHNCIIFGFQISAHGKLRINDICVMDLVSPSTNSTEELLREDLRSLGIVIASLANRVAWSKLDTQSHDPLFEFIREACPLFEF